MKQEILDYMAGEFGFLDMVESALLLGAKILQEGFGIETGKEEDYSGEVARFQEEVALEEAAAHAAQFPDD